MVDCVHFSNWLQNVQSALFITSYLDFDELLIIQSANNNNPGLTLEMSATHHIPQATNMPYQPLLIKPIFSVLAHAEKGFFKTSLPVLIIQSTIEDPSAKLLLVTFDQVSNSP